MTERKKIALMFTDIASFTNISEKLTAPEVVEMLNTYFEEANFALK
jgi:class 3 adenylate cyclase